MSKTESETLRIMGFLFMFSSDGLSFSKVLSDKGGNWEKGHTKRSERSAQYWAFCQNHVRRQPNASWLSICLVLQLLWSKRNMTLAGINTAEYSMLYSCWSWCLYFLTMIYFWMAKDFVLISQSPRWHNQILSKTKRFSVYFHIWQRKSIKSSQKLKAVNVWYLCLKTETINQLSK